MTNFKVIAKGTVSREMTPVMRETLDALKRCQTPEERMAVYNAGVAALGFELAFNPHVRITDAQAEDCHLEESRERDHE